MSPSAAGQFPRSTACVCSDVHTLVPIAPGSRLIALGLSIFLSSRVSSPAERWPRRCSRQPPSSSISQLSVAVALYRSTATKSRRQRCIPLAAAQPNIWSQGMGRTAMKASTMSSVTAARAFLCRSTISTHGEEGPPCGTGGRFGAAQRGDHVASVASPPDPPHLHPNHASKSTPAHPSTPPTPLTRTPILSNPCSGAHPSALQSAPP